MYCKCNNSYNYQVVGTCDNPSQYDTDEKEAWTQITVPEILTIPECYPDVENVERIYVNVKIDTTEVMDTPSKAEPNEEGTFLTGRQILVDGVICQTVVYTADTCEQSLHSVNFKFPFCTYIMIPDDGTDIELLEYCIDVCIEDVYAKVLNNRVIFKNVTLFLKAEQNNTDCCNEEDKTAAISVTTTYSGSNLQAVPVTLKLYNEGVFINSTVVAVPAGEEGIEYTFEDLCPGTYSVVATVDNDEFEFDVVVNPEEVTVADGETGDITVTISDIA